MKQIYLDYAAATPMDPAVAAAMRLYFTDNFYNPSATYLAGRAAKSVLDDARAKIAQNLGARPAEIIFTAGATEANNLAIQGVMEQFPAGEILVSSIEHESVLAPAKKFKYREIPVNKQGIIDLQKFEEMLTDKTVLVSVMLVNNEIGTVQPIKEIAKILNKLSIFRKNKKNELPIYLHTDAAQAPMYMDIHTARLGVDLLSINGGKMYGPKQSGVLYVKTGTKLLPQILGGGQEFGLRSGTENLAAAVGLAKSLELAQSARKSESERVQKLRTLFAQELQPQMPKVIINGSDKHSAPHIVSVTFPGLDNEKLMIELDENGIMAAVGSACSASNDEPSHVLKAIGLKDQQARATLRFSFGRATTAAELQKAVHKIAEFVAV